MEMRVVDLQERSKVKMREVLKRFITVDSHGAVKNQRLGKDLGVTSLGRGQVQQRRLPTSSGSRRSRADASER